MSSFSDAPKGPRLTNQVIYLVSSQIRLKCPVINYANAKTTFVEWTRNNMPIEYNSRYFVSVNGLLRIDMALPEDSGIYNCKAINGFGSSSANITVDVIGNEDDLIYLVDPLNDESSNQLIIPSIASDFGGANKNVQLEKTIYRQLGKSVKFKCKVDDKFVSVVQWFKEGKIIHHKNLFNVKIDRNVLHINNLKAKDFGEYECSYPTSGGEYSAKFKLIKKGEYKF